MIELQCLPQPLEIRIPSLNNLAKTGSGHNVRVVRLLENSSLLFDEGGDLDFDVLTEEFVGGDLDAVNDLGVVLVLAGVVEFQVLVGFLPFVLFSHLG